MHARDTILYIQQRIIIQIDHIRFQPDLLKIFRKLKKKKKTPHKLGMIYT